MFFVFDPEDRATVKQSIRNVSKGGYVTSDSVVKDIRNRGGRVSRAIVQAVIQSELERGNLKRDNSLRLINASGN